MMTQPLEPKIGGVKAPAIQESPPSASRSGQQRAVAGPGSIPGSDPRIAAAVAGDRRAASDLVSALLPRVRNLVRYLVPGDRDVDDFTQAALLEALRALPRFEGRSALTTWVDRITVRETLRRVKRRRLQVSRNQDLEREQSLASEPPPPLDESYHAKRQLARILDDLPIAQREVLVLHHVLGMTVPEVATELGVPFDTAKSRLRLAVTRLRQLHGERDG